MDYCTTFKVSKPVHIPAVTNRAPAGLKMKIIYSQTVFLSEEAHVQIRQNIACILRPQKRNPHLTQNPATPGRASGPNPKTRRIFLYATSIPAIFV